MISRRTFLGAAPAVLARGARGQNNDRTLDLTPAPTPVGSSFDPWIEVNAQNLRHNVGEVARRAGTGILAVIKNNGYGLGLVNVARLLEREQAIEGFAVVKLQEAATLRDAGIVKPILLMGPFSEQELVDEIAPRDIMPMVYRDYGNAFDRAAARRRPGGPLPVHIKVDTGLGRVGVPYASMWELVDSLESRASTAIVGVMTTLSEDPLLDEEQLRRFDRILSAFAGRGNRSARFHAASSYALFRTEGGSAVYDLVRPGMALVGVYSEPAFRRLGVMDLRPALALRARVALVKQLQPGDSAGYNRAFRPDRPTWLATLPVGHADGWPRIAAKGARVRIGERLYPVVASVSASHTIVDLGAHTTVAPGDIVTLFDWNDGSRPEDVAEACGASVYDLTMHLGALLQRRVVA